MQSLHSWAHWVSLYWKQPVICAVLLGEVLLAAEIYCKGSRQGAGGGDDTKPAVSLSQITAFLSHALAASITLGMEWPGAPVAAAELGEKSTGCLQPKEASHPNWLHPHLMS